MDNSGFDQPRPNDLPKEVKRTINPSVMVAELTRREKQAGLIKQIDLQMVVGSAGMVVNGLLPAEIRPIKDLDTVTVVGSYERADNIRKFFDENRKELALCEQTSDVFVASPSTGRFAEEDGPYPMDNILHMLTWARPHVVRMSDHFRNTVLRNACRGILNNTHITELPDDYLVAAASIGALLEEDLSTLTTQQIRELVDVATQYKIDYYTGKHNDYAIKTSVSLPGNLKWKGLWEKLNSFGIK